MTRSLSVLALFVAAPLFAADPRVGWRGDGTGRFPDARPPTRWSAKGDGVAWKAPLPGISNSGPIAVGGRVFTVCEPATLVCLSAEDGKQLWADTLTFFDTVPEGDPEAADIIARWKKAATEKEKFLVRKDILRSNYFEVPPVMGHHFGFTLEYTFPTPASDGERVYVAYGTGLVAAYALDGKRLWSRVLTKPRSSTGFTASPLLAGGRLLVNMGGDLHGLDPATGKTVWTTPQKECYGSPVRAAVGGVEVAVLPKGDVVRAADGKKLAAGAAVNYYQSAVVDGDVVYSMRDDPFSDDKGDTATKMLAARLKPGPGGAVTVEKLWEGAKPTGYGSPVVHDGLVYAGRNKIGLCAFDAKAGRPVYTERVRSNAENYPSPALAGPYLFVPFQDGTVGVVKPGREFELVGVNDVCGPGDQLVGSPFFAGDRLYLRTHQFLVCVGPE